MVFRTARFAPVSYFSEDLDTAGLWVKFERVVRSASHKMESGSNITSTLKEIKSLPLSLVASCCCAKEMLFMPVFVFKQEAN